MSSKVKVWASTAYPGHSGTRNVHLKLACGHSVWRAKRMTMVACEKCKKERS